MNPPAKNTRKGFSRRDFLKLFSPSRIDLHVETSALSKGQVAPQRFALDALKDLPEPVLRQTVPVLRRDLVTSIQNEGIAFHGEADEEGLVPLRREACEAVRLFDGLRTLDQAGSVLEVELAGPPGSGFLLAREAFLVLSACGIYHPAGPPENKPPVPVAKPEKQQRNEPGEDLPRGDSNPC